MCKANWRLSRFSIESSPHSPAGLFYGKPLGDIERDTYEVFSVSYTDLMAHLEGESSMVLFEILEEWDWFLKQFAPFFKEAA